MKKLCCIFNIPSLYREAIYQAIDSRYNCEWYFEDDRNEGIALFDRTKLKSSYQLEHVNVFGRLYRMRGLTRRVWNRKEIDSYLIIGAPMCLSIWILCVLLKIFHPKKKICFWTHGWYGKETKAERLIKKRFLKLADELFVYGNYAKRLLVKEGFRENKIHVIHNSLSYDTQLSIRQELTPSFIYEHHFGNNDPVLIFIGRLMPVKRLDMLVDVVAKLADKGEWFNLVFVGDGPEKERLAAKVESLNLSSRVWFYGACYDGSINAELIYNADLCISPGNIGLTAIHVLMFGCPAITHNDLAYQMPEFEAIKPNSTGNFFVRDSVDSLMGVISEWKRKYGSQRQKVREACYREIDEQWTPRFQMEIINKVLG